MHRLQRLRDDAPESDVAATFRRESPGVVATLTRTVGDLGVAEDAVQDAFVVALERWPVDGIPDRPGAWIVTTARHKAFDRLRRESKRDQKHLDAHRSLAALDGWDQPDPSTVRDDMLRLVFICCHPVLPAESRVALALRTLCGLRTEEVARLLLASPAATGQRIVRAKRKLADAAVRFELPTTQDMPDRLPAVLATVHLLFTEGHTSSGSDTHVRADLCTEAVRLSGLLAELMPDEPEVLGLQALLLLTHARRATRVDDHGDLVLLADQARDRWAGEEIDRGVALVESALRHGRAGRYQLEAAIAACHATAPSFDETDWVEIASLYALLEGIAPSPVVHLNRAVAVGQAFGPGAGLEVLDTLEGELDGHHLRWAVEADLHRRSGASGPAVACYRRALACGPNAAERRFLQMRVDQLEAP